MPNREQTQLINRKHDLAMDQADRARLAKQRGDHERSVSLFRSALEHELAAIAGFSGEVLQPTHAVLHGSAGWLAIDCDLPEKAIQLAEAGLAQDPSNEFRLELEMLLSYAGRRLSEKRRRLNAERKKAAK